MNSRLFGLSTGWLVAAMLLATGCSLGSLIYASALAAGFWSFFWAAVGSALLSTVLALGVSEVVLKPLFTADLLRLAHLEARFSSIALRDVGLQDRIDWRSLYSKASEIDIVVDDPKAWMSRDLDNVIACAARRARVRIFMPAPEGDASRQVADLLSVPLDGYREQVLDVEKRVKEAWTRRQGKHVQAEIQIHFLLTAPASFMARFDDEVVIAIEAGLGREAKPIMYMHAGYKGTADVQGWIQDRWQWLQVAGNTTSGWASRKMETSSAEVRKQLGTRLAEEGGEQ